VRVKVLLGGCYSKRHMGLIGHHELLFSVWLTIQPRELSFLALDPFQLLFHLRVGDRGLDGGSSLHGEMSKIVDDLFQGPSDFSCTMYEIMPKVMKREVSNQLSLLLVSLAFE
jgi:hypothetical protein